MKITKHLNQDAYDVALIGDFTFGDHTEFRVILDKIEDKDIQHVNLDMAQLNFVDSAALGMLLLALDAAEKNKKGLVVVGAQGQVKKMFDMARFDKLFRMEQKA